MDNVDEKDEKAVVICPAYGDKCPFGCDPKDCIESDTDGDGNSICLRCN